MEKRTKMAKTPELNDLQSLQRVRNRAKVSTHRDPAKNRELMDHLTKAIAILENEQFSAPSTKRRTA